MAGSISGAKLDFYQRKWKKLTPDEQKGPEGTALLEKIETEKSIGREIVEGMKEYQTEGASTLQRGIQGALVSIPVTAGALVTGYATRSPALGVAMLYPLTSWQKYSELVALGVPEDIAASHAKFQGVVESLTELFPTGRLLAKLPLGRMLIETILADVPGEVVATFLQGGSDYVAAEQMKGNKVTPEMVLTGVLAQRSEVPVGHSS